MRHALGARTLLYVNHADNIALATHAHRLWGDLLALGCNELDVNPSAETRIDRLVLTAHIIKRCEPLLNVLEDQGRPSETVRRELQGVTGGVANLSLGRGRP